MKDDDILKMIEKEIDDEIASQVYSEGKRKKHQKKSTNRSQKNTLPSIGSNPQTGTEPTKEDLFNVDNSIILDDLLEEQSPGFDTKIPEQTKDEHELIVSEPETVQAKEQEQPEPDELENLQLEVAALKHDIVALKLQLEERGKEMDETRESMDRNSTIQAVFAERGITGSTEIVSAIKALTSAKKLSDFISSITIVDEPRVRRLLDEHVQLVSKNVPKELSSGHARVVVSSERCELAGDVNVDFAQRRFIDGLVVNGYRQVVIFGAPVRMLTPLRTLAAHHQLNFTLGPSIDRLTVECIKPLLVDKPVVLVWNPTETAFDPKLISDDVLNYKTSTAGSLAGFLLDIGDQLLLQSSVVDAE